MQMARPRNAARTRAAILAAVKDRFTNEIYDQVGVRQIAADAGVDAALICRYFGSKEQLFATVVAESGRAPMEILSGTREDFGVRAARALFDPSHRSHKESLDFINLAMRSTMSSFAREQVQQHIERRFVIPFSTWLGERGAAEKAWLVASVLMGVSAMRGIVSGADCLADRQETFIQHLARTLQAIVDKGSTQAERVTGRESFG